MTLGSRIFVMLNNFVANNSNAYSAWNSVTIIVKAIVTGNIKTSNNLYRPSIIVRINHSWITE